MVSLAQHPTSLCKRRSSRVHALVCPRVRPQAQGLLRAWLRAAFGARIGPAGRRHGVRVCPRIELWPRIKL